MTININNLNNNTQVHQNQQAQVKQNASQAANANTSVKQDSVSLTPQAKQLSELQKKSADLPSIDQKKIDELKARIASGDYKVDPQKLAASIANFEFDLI